jgi:ornithine cyclodeaminase
MRHIDAATVHAKLDFETLISALNTGFEEGATVPVRHRHDLGTVAAEEAANQANAEANDGASLLLMPAWRQGGPTGVKIVTVYPTNRARALPAVNATFLLLDGKTGHPLAIIDGPALTERRTAAASALASRYLSRPFSKILLMVGAGAIAPHLIRAHASVRPIERIEIWNRTPERAVALAETMRSEGLNARATNDLEVSARAADIISCATLSTEPIILGAWLSPGCHLDLVGAFRPDMRECDDVAVVRAAVYVDVRESALIEAGDIAGPLARGVISKSHILGDLFDLARGVVTGRGDDDTITMFKSVGTALEDLAAAESLWAKLGELER